MFTGKKLCLTINNSDRESRGSKQMLVQDSRITA